MVRLLPLVVRSPRPVERGMASCGAGERAALSPAPAALLSDRRRTAANRGLARHGARCGHPGIPAWWRHRPKRDRPEPWRPSLSCRHRLRQPRLSRPSLCLCHRPETCVSRCLTANAPASGMCRVRPGVTRVASSIVSLWHALVRPAPAQRCAPPVSAKRQADVDCSRCASRPRAAQTPQGHQPAGEWAPRPQPLRCRQLHRPLGSSDQTIGSGDPSIVPITTGEQGAAPRPLAPAVTPPRRGLDVRVAPRPSCGRCRTPPSFVTRFG